MADVTVTDADREAAAAVQNRWLSQRVSEHGSVQWTHEDYIAQAIARARAEEREACAVLCEALDSCETDLGWTHCPERYAAAIRARGEQGGE